MTMFGFLGGETGPEIWSCSIALAKGPEEANLSELFNAQPNNTVWTDLSNDCQIWFSRPQSRIKPWARLRGVKFAAIGADGRYTGPPIERDAFNTPGGGSGSLGASSHPYQVALATTFHTSGDLGRLKGRIYQPAPDIPSSGATGQIAIEAADEVRGSMDQFLEAIGNQPGADVLDLRAVVASQGRRNPDGSQRTPPQNVAITGVSVGRVLDTIRSRRNKITDKGTLVPVSF
jgi:hypothetical protein